VFEAGQRVLDVAHHAPKVSCARAIADDPNEKGRTIIEKNDMCRLRIQRRGKRVSTRFQGRSSVEPSNSVRRHLRAARGRRRLRGSRDICGFASDLGRAQDGFGAVAATMAFDEFDAALDGSLTGTRVRLIDRLPRHVVFQAGCRHPRTLALLEPSGVTAKLRHRQRSTAAVSHKGLYRADRFDALPNRQLRLVFRRRRPNGCWLKTLNAAARGRRARRRTRRMPSLPRRPPKPSCARRGSDANPQMSWILAADGAHSAARKCLRTEFEGSTL